MRLLHVRYRAPLTPCHSSSGQSSRAWSHNSFTKPNSTCQYKNASKLTSTRALSTTYSVLKSGGKQNSKNNVEVASAKISSLPYDDPFDLSDLESRLEQILSRLRDDLAKLRPGGRFNPKVIEDLRVQLAKENKETERLGNLAQVVPKGGRSIVLYVGEEAHVKSISSSILSSSLSLNPQRSTTNSLELTIHVPPPTAESRKHITLQALKAGTDAHGVIRMARGAHQRKLRAMGLSRTVGPDDLKRAQDKMEKAVEKANADAKKMTEEARKVLEKV